LVDHQKNENAIAGSGCEKKENAVAGLNLPMVNVSTICQ